ncbi:precorrin-6y C5,15-methyltransferase (decarboxylating) subunit CbiE [Nocardioides convexus]|uniref:precorrin-6y C5,15-methyltransferase (decarboxylating) subunit CbiE n=1 Tax=Nocardioides convexus TaxID=2712224 RepID=UPI002418AD25|nr:precorrin-6y C5,15-methyltransferase (decarboxylating) subunit CbiE [Nocardioides convexus]
MGGLRITVVGIGADGHLPPAARGLVEDAEVLLGGERHLALVPAVAGQVRAAWPRPLSSLATFLGEYDGRRIVALASGDPLVSGIGSTLVRLLGPDAVTVVPAVSSVALARARMGWSAEESTLVSLVGRDVAALRRELVAGARLLVLSSDEHTPATVAALLSGAGFGASTIEVLGDLGGPEESRGTYPCPVPRLHVLAIEVAGDGFASWAPGLPDEAFEHDGQAHQARRPRQRPLPARAPPRPACSGTSARVPARSASSGCAPTRAPPPWRWRRTPSGRSASRATPGRSAYRGCGW